MAEKKKTSAKVSEAASKKATPKAAPKKKSAAKVKGYEMQLPEKILKVEKKPRKKVVRDPKIEKAIIADYRADMSYKDLSIKYPQYPSRGSVYQVLVRNKIIVAKPRKK